MSTRFDQDTALERVNDTTFTGRIDRGWWIVAGPNGGYIAALVVSAMEAVVDDAERSARSVTVHYLRRPREGELRIEVTVERSGRTLSTLSAKLVQGDRVMVQAIGAFAAKRDGFSFADLDPPRFPPADECPPLASLVELHRRYDVRMAFGEPFGAGADHAFHGGYIRLAEPRIVDASVVAAFADALPPAVFMRASSREDLGPVPTIDLTVHFRAGLPLPDAKPDDYYLITFRSRLGAEGYLEEDGEIWSPGGVLVAQSRQLALSGMG